LKKKKKKKKIKPKFYQVDIPIYEYYPMEINQSINNASPKEDPSMYALIFELIQN